MAAPGRSTWKGFLRLSLVTCAVKLVPATTSSGQISFHQLNRKTLDRVRIQLVDDATGDPVDRADIVKGYEFEKGRYVVIDDAAVDEIKLESSHTLDIDRFVAQDEIDPAFLDSVYYLAPDGKVAGEAYAVIREAMRRSGRAGVGRIVLSQRERAAVVRPLGRGLAMTTLRGAQEVRAAAPYFEDAPEALPANGEELVSMAGLIIDRLAGHWDPADYEDRYQQALQSIVDAQVAGTKPAVPHAQAPGKVVNLFEALRKSVEAEGGAPAKAAPKAPAAAAKPAPAKPVRSSRKRAS